MNALLCDYDAFLASKRAITESFGFEPAPLPSHLFDFQQAVAKWAIVRGRAAIFAGTGMGKTAMQLEWARQGHAHSNAPVLIVAPLAVSSQTVREGAKFGVVVNQCRRVLTPFLGIGSEAYVAVQMRRHAIGAELKASYYAQAVANIR